MASWYTLPIAGAVLILTALILSYRQIIYAYPKVRRILFLKQILVRNGIASWRVFISRLYINGGSEYFFRADALLLHFTYIILKCLLHVY